MSLRFGLATLVLAASCSSRPAPSQPPPERPIREQKVPAANQTSTRIEVRGRISGKRLELWVAGPDGPMALEVSPHAWNDPVIAVETSEPLADDTLIALPDQGLIRRATVADGGLRLELHSPTGTVVQHDESSPGELTVLPKHCARCELEGDRCIEWETMDCGIERTCSGAFDCEPGCCG